MKFGKNLLITAIPEWRQCYIQYESLKIYVIIIEQCMLGIQSIRHKIQNNQRNRRTIMEDSQIQQDTEFHYNTKKEIKRIMETANFKFYSAYRMNMNISQLFYHMKLLQLQDKFQLCQELTVYQQEHREMFLEMVEYIYIETAYLSEMKESNLEAQRKILKKHKKYANGELQTPTTGHQKFRRLERQLKFLIDKLEELYIKHNYQPSKKSRKHLRDIAAPSSSQKTDSLISGIWIGISLSVLVVMVVILSYNSIHVQSNHRFSRDFPTWRGVAIIIFYVWVLGFNIWAFEKYKISHAIIFQFDDHHRSSAIDIFKLAGFFTTVFLILFLLYAMEITNIASLGPLKPEYNSSICWGLVALYLIIPVPLFNYKGRIYALKLIFKSITAPCLGVTFPVIWATDQLVSLVTPLIDLTYTICYYTQLNFNYLGENPCRDNARAELVLVVGTIAYSYRMMQCIRQGYDKGQYLFTHEMFNTFKYFTSLLTLILSFFYKLGNDPIFTAWIIMASISTIYSYIWDIKIDWALFQNNPKHPFLRKYITFQPALYYIIMILNLLMRCVWTLTLSPNITNIFGNPNIFSLVTGSIQILRRGIWNVLRVERQHLANCTKFQAIPEDQKCKQILVQRDHILEETQQINNHFINLIRSHIQQRDKVALVQNQAYLNEQLDLLDKLLKAKPMQPMQPPQRALETQANAQV